MSRQIDEATARRGPGDVAALLRSGSTWTVELALRHRSSPTGSTRTGVDCDVAGPDVDVT